MIIIILTIVIIIVIIAIIIITNNYNNNKSEEDLCTTVSIVLSANSGTFSPVFVNSLLLTSAVMGYILCRLNDWRVRVPCFYSGAVANSKLDYSSNV